MSFWIREILGWVLLILGLAAFYMCIGLLLRAEPKFFRAAFLLIIGFFVFRGGIHLLKTAVAARICLKAQQQAARSATDRSR